MTLLLVILQHTLHYKVGETRGNAHRPPASLPVHVPLSYRSLHVAAITLKFRPVF